MNWLESPNVPQIAFDMESLLKSYDKMMGAGLGVSPLYLANRTAYGALQQQAQSLPSMQRMMNGIHNSILDVARICLDPYMPVELKQFRFPRSKKKRIRKKWSKNPRNWKEVPILFKIKIDSGIKYPPIKPWVWPEQPYHYHPAHEDL